jgi:hypothetical protein
VAAHGALLGFLARLIQRLAARALRLLIFGHRVLRLVRLRFFSFLAISHLSLSHQILLSAPAEA